MSTTAEGLTQLLDECGVSEPSTKSRLAAEGVRSLDDLLELPSDALTLLFQKLSLPFIHEFKINQLVQRKKTTPKSPLTPERGPRRARNHVEAVRAEELKKLNIGRTTEDPYTGEGAEDGETPLLYVARCGTQEQLELLLNSGARPNSKDQQNRTALHNAAERGDAEMVRTLLEVGAPTDAQDDNGRTPLYLAAKNGGAGAARVLLEHKADPNQPNMDENVPLSSAAYGGHAAVIAALAEHRADLRHTNRHGEDALFWATTRDHVEAAALLTRLLATP